GVIERGFANLILCIQRFYIDLSLICEKFNLDPNSKIKDINILQSSDRHCNQQSLLIKLTSGFRIIYKPVDLRPDTLFAEFVSEMRLPNLYSLKCLDIISRDSYG